MKTVKKIDNMCNSFLLKIATKMQQLTFWDMFKITMIITTALVITYVLSNTVFAANVDAGIGKIDAFDQLTGANSQWLSSTYRNNYYLDINSLGFSDVFEKAANGLANILFSLICILSYICIAVFYFCFDTSIADLFKNAINGIQDSLKSGIFDNVFLVAFVFIAVYLITQLLKRNTAEIISQMLKVIFIIIVAFLLTTETSSVITESTEIAKSIGAEAVVAINNQESTQDYAASVSGTLWYSLVHEPWEMMEANNKLSQSQEEDILSKAPESDSRQDIIKSINKDDGSIFDKEEGIFRIPQAFIILVITILKAGIMLLIALIQVAFQVMAILCVLLSMIALLLAMVPQMGGIAVIENLAKRIFETQLGIVVTTFILALITKMDSLIMVDFAQATKCGWLICLIMQTAIYISMYVFRKNIFKMINVVSKNAKNGHLVPRNFVNDKAHRFTERSSDIGLRSVRRAGDKTLSAVGSPIRSAAKSMGNKIKGNKPNGNNENENSNNMNNGTKNENNLRDKINDKENNSKSNATNGINKDNKNNGNSTINRKSGLRSDLKNNLNENNRKSGENPNNKKVLYAKDYMKKPKIENNNSGMNLSNSSGKVKRVWASTPNNGVRKMNIERPNVSNNGMRIRPNTQDDRAYNANRMQSVAHREQSNSVGNDHSIRDFTPNDTSMTHTAKSSNTGNNASIVHTTVSNSGNNTDKSYIATPGKRTAKISSKVNNPVLNNRSNNTRKSNSNNGRSLRLSNNIRKRA